jgi:hypothetical protein
MILAGALALALLATFIQTLRLDAEQKAFELFQVQAKAVGDAAVVAKKLKEQEHEKVLTDVSQAWQGSLDAAVTGAVARYAARMSGNNPGGGSLRGIASDPKALDGAGGERLACAPDEPFIEACAADAKKIDSFQIWARLIGFELK